MKYILFKTLRQEGIKMPKLYTIGHSNHSLDDFIGLLHSQKINHLVDVRTVPKSKHVPWFNKTSFRLALIKENIRYTHVPELGGFRKTHSDSINQGWRNLNFRGFADYMQTSEFYSALKKLNQLIKLEKRVAIMCAEAVPWRCHRSLIADAELIRGITVLDIMSATSLHAHQLTAFAVVNKKRKPLLIYYPKMEGESE